MGSRGPPTGREMNPGHRAQISSHGALLSPATLGVEMACFPGQSAEKQAGSSDPTQQESPVVKSREARTELWCERPCGQPSSPCLAVPRLRRRLC